MSYFLIGNNGNWGKNLNILDNLLYDTDTNYLGENTVLIIKGEVVCPKSIETATRYEF